MGEDNLKRELQELYGHDDFTAGELAKRNISFDAAKEICISILGLIGIQAGGAASVHVEKRDMFQNVGHGILTQFRTTVPQATFKVSDVAWVRDDVFEVNVAFENVESARLFENFSAELKLMSVTGTGFDNTAETLWDGGAVRKVDNFAKWSHTFLVKATPQLKGFYCMPSTFSINYNWNARPDSVLHSVWSEHFATEYHYTLSQDFDHRQAANVEHKILQSYAELSQDSMRYWQAASNELPNYCWPAQCK